MFGKFRNNFGMIQLKFGAKTLTLGKLLGEMSQIIAETVTKKIKSSQ